MKVNQYLSTHHTLISLGLLYHITEAITRRISLERKASSNPQFLNVLTRPLTHRIIEVKEKTKLSFLHQIKYVHF